jgi:hypothetical protein
MPGPSVISGGAGAGGGGLSVPAGTIIEVPRNVLAFPRGAAFWAAASTVNLSGGGSAIADVTAGRPIQLAFSAYKLPPIPGRIIGVRKSIINRLIYTAPSVLFPRVRYQFYAPHPTDYAPCAAIDPNYTPEVFGATTWITSGGAAGTTQQVASTAGMVAGDTLRFLVFGGTSVDRVIAPNGVIDSTHVVLTATITTTAVQIVCKVWPAASYTNPNSSVCDVEFLFASGPVVSQPTTEGWLWRGEMVEDCNSTGTHEGPVTLSAQGTDRFYRCWYNNRAANAQTEPYWSGASLGTNIAAASFPADPHSGNNLTAGGSGNWWGVASDSLLYEVGTF